MAQSGDLNGNLKPQQKKTTICTIMGPATDSNSQAQTFWKRLRKGLSFVRGPNYRRSIKEENKVTNHSWINNHARSLLHNCNVSSQLLL